MDKSALRKQMRELRRALSPREIEQRSDVLAARLFMHPAWKKAETVYVYLSYNQEVRTDAIIRRAVSEGKRVAAPRVLDQQMDFFRLNDCADAIPGYHGIPEPPETAPPADALDALVLAPGLAFTPDGQRLGYGGGFYDRFFAKEPNHYVIGLCYDFQLVAALPTEPHDRPVDAVLTDAP
ncbi:MAG: 5-formyltetrahydrofolate cyclo-ligase [Clostridia bacterium]|nr:5-formyltetrahydrofolate cyclo-ligase [Clostridia bacterium]